MFGDYEQITQECVILFSSFKEEALFGFSV